MLGDRLARLEDSACYPGAAGAAVEIVQTHISIVCLVGDRAYKLKKPVRLPFVDFSTLPLREAACRDELRLNRRLCPDVYLDVLPLRDDGARLRLGDGPGEVVDWAVCMRRLPQERMLDRMVADGTAEAADIDRIAAIVAAFHARADRGPRVHAAGDPARLAGFAAANFAETEPLCGDVWPAPLHAFLRDRSARDFAAMLPVLRARADRGLVVDGHGDLHCRNVCLCEPPVIYDCLEFSAALRCGDVATENAFFVMDLAYRGRRDLAARYLDAYVAHTGDDEQRVLMPALLRYRAMVRAKVEGLTCREREIPAADRRGAALGSRRHLRLAAATALEEHAPPVVAACGLPASGKSFVLRRLGRELGWPYVSTDLTRRETARELIATGGSLYSEQSKNTNYETVLDRARRAAERSGLPVLVDGTFSSPHRRARVAALAAALGRPALVVWFDADDATIRARLAARARDPDAVSEADVAVYEELRARFVAPAPGEAAPALRVDGAADYDALADAILGALAAAQPRGHPPAP